MVSFLYTVSCTNRLAFLFLTFQPASDGGVVSESINQSINQLFTDSFFFVHVHVHSIPFQILLNFLFGLGF